MLSTVLAFGSAIAIQPQEVTCEHLERPEMTAAQKAELVTCVFRGVARETSANLPHRVDELSEIVSLIAAGPAAIYTVRVDRDAADFSASEVAIAEQNVRQRTCNLPNTRETFEFGGSYHYVYVDRRGYRLNSFSIDRCP